MIKPKKQEKKINSQFIIFKIALIKKNFNLLPLFHPQRNSPRSASRIMFIVTAFTWQFQCVKFSVVSSKVVIQNKGFQKIEGSLTKNLWISLRIGEKVVQNFSISP